VDYYNRTLKDSPEAQPVISSSAALSRAKSSTAFKLGYANRSLCLHLPASNRAAGDAQRTRLKELGILRNQKAGARALQWFAGVPVFILPVKWWRCTGGRSRRICGLERRTTRIFRGRIGACGTKKPSLHRRNHPMRSADRRR